MTFMLHKRAMTMMERRDAQGDAMLAFLRDAYEHGVHVYTPEELHPGVDWSDPHQPKPRIDPTELLYDYGEQAYQVIFNGTSIYHHRLIGTVFGARPFRRHPPTPAAPWQTPAAERRA